MTEDDFPRSPAAPDDAGSTGDRAVPLPEAAESTDPETADTGTTDTGTTDMGTTDMGTADIGDAAQPEKRRRGRPKGSASTARTTRIVELTLTVAEGADGEWQAELKQGAAWISRGLPVTAASVLRAAQELHAELADPIEAAIGSAREARAARVAALEAELEQARKALAELEG
ncbi:DUF6319 family protein [Pseudonocardia charpentierae]